MRPTGSYRLSDLRCGARGPTLIGRRSACGARAEQARQARKGVQPSLVHVPNAGDTWFADLNRIGTVRKSYAAQCGSRRGAISDEARSRFARLVGRKFSRFPLPDDVVYWFKPLQTVAASKHGNPLSAEGRAFERVEEFRIESAKSWSELPYELTLVVVLKRDELPVFGNDEYPDITREIEAEVRPGGRLRQADQLATMLEESRNPVQRYWIWQALAEAWAGKCRPKQGDLKHSDPKRGPTLCPRSRAARSLST